MATYLSDNRKSEFTPTISYVELNLNITINQFLKLLTENKDKAMMYVPPQKSKQEQWKDSVKREQRLRNRRLRDKPGLSKMMRNQLSTTQGMSTLKLVLMFSVLGMILHWILPGILQNLNPEMMEDEAKYYGTLGAICITGFFLLISLLKGLIQRNRSSQQEQPSNTQHIDTKNAENKGLLDGK